MKRTVEIYTLCLTVLLQDTEGKEYVNFDIPGHLPSESSAELWKSYMNQNMEKALEQRQEAQKMNTPKGQEVFKVVEIEPNYSKSIVFMDVESYFALCHEHMALSIGDYVYGESDTEIDQCSGECPAECGTSEGTDCKQDGGSGEPEGSCNGGAKCQSECSGSDTQDGGGSGQ